MRLVPAAFVLALATAPALALAQTAGSLPPPVPRPAEPAPAAPAPGDAAPARQPGLGERTGAAIDRAADSTGQALERAKNAGVIARFGFHQTGNHAAQLRIIQPAVGLAEPEQAACGGSGDFGDLHEEGKGKR